MSFRDVPTEKTIPQSCDFSLPPTSIPARRFRTEIKPQTAPSGNQTSAFTVSFYIPTRPYQMLDTSTIYLRGKVSAVLPALSTSWLNRNAYSLIDRIQVFGGSSVLLEDSGSNYGDLIQCMLDSTLNSADLRGLSTLIANSDVPYNSTAPIDRTHYGYSIGSGSLTFAIPLLSSICGQLNKKMLPVGWCQNDIRVDITFQTPAVCFRQHDTSHALGVSITGYTMSDLNICADFVDFSASAHTMDELIGNKPIYMAVDAWAGYQNVIPSGTAGFYQWLISHRSLSVKGILSDAHKANVAGYDYIGGRVSPYGSNDFGISLSVGGQQYPNPTLHNFQDQFAELLKFWHAFDTLTVNSSLCKSEYEKYNGDLTSVATSLQCKNIIGIDTEVFQHSDRYLCGMDWSNVNTFLQGNVYNDSGTTSLANALTQNVWVLYDKIVVIEGGQISTRS